MEGNKTSSMTFPNVSVVTWIPTEAPIAPENNSYVKWLEGDSCACLNSGQRSCASCLDSLLLNGESCIVTPMGLCTSASNAAVTNLFERLPGSYFWSHNTSYCSSNDTLCTQCRANWIKIHARGGLSNLQATCFGGGGCVCTPHCELRALGIIAPNDTLYITGKELCSSSTIGSSDWSDSYAANVALMRNITFLLCGAVLVAMTARSAVAQFHQRRYDRRMLERRQALREQREAATTRSGLALSLNGWNSYRERLIENEQQHLGLKPNAIALSQAPVRVVVEEGEGFRPASPSQHARRHMDVE